MNQVELLQPTKLLLRMDAAALDQSARFYPLAFQVPAGCVSLTVTLDLDCGQSAQIPLCLFDANGQVRLMKAGHSVVRDTLSYTIGEETACSGGLTGPILPGTWKLLLYKRRMRQDAHVTLRITAETGVSAAAQTVPLTFASAALDKSARWYQGELHTHSCESTGRTSVQDVVDAARHVGLDFLAVTDHFTASHWPQLQKAFDGQGPLLLQSVEVSGDRGHANLHGLTSWLNPLVDDNAGLSDFLGLKEAPSMNQLARDTHKQGGLFCINHALSGEVGWRYSEFDLRQADLVEAWCLADTDAGLAYSGFYDALLCRGYRITAVGSSDSHHPTRPGPWMLGQVRTYVYADELSQRALLQGLKAGRAYVSVHGCEMDMTAHCGEKSAMMGDELLIREGAKAQLIIALKKHPRGNLYLYLSGMLWEARFVDSDAPVTLTLDLPESAAGDRAYVRAEFYEIEGELPYYGYSWRSWETLRLLSNPIYLTKGE